MKTVLVITYYWPPAGGPGVQRVLKFVKYLPLFGWQPVVLTVQKGAYPSRDETLAAEIPENMMVYKTRIWEPAALYKKFTGMSGDEAIPVSVLAEPSRSFSKRFSNWVRLNLFIPDAKRGWKRFAVKKGKDIIDEFSPEIIFSSSPPPTVHLIASALAGYKNTKWVADFRDPWTEIHYYEHHRRNRLSARLDSKLEKKVLDHADRITCISSRYISDDFAAKTDTEKCVFLPNGYDEEDFAFVESGRKKDDVFRIMHLGAVGMERNPDAFFKAIHKLHSKKQIDPKKFRLIFVGRVEQRILAEVKKYQIEPFFEIVPYKPHREALAYAAHADVLLLLITRSGKNKRILPGKTFEYLRMAKPLLVFGPEGGEVDRILRETSSGGVIDYKKADKIEQKLTELWSAWQKNKLSVLQRSGVEQFERKALAGRLAGIFNILAASDQNGKTNESDQK